jgi:hypothetical protein
VRTLTPSTERPQPAPHVSPLIAAMSQRPLASSRRAATPPSPRSATRASPAPLPSSSSSITRSTTPSQRAHSWCQQIVQLWEKRHSQTGAAHAAEVSQQIARAAQGVLAAAGASTTATTSQVAVSVLHQHAHDLLRVTQEAVEMWLKSSASKVDASSASSSPAISNSTDDASSSVAAPPATFALAPAALQLLLRLIVLLCQCLPAHYSKAWSAANPLPPALNSDDFAGGVEKPTPLAKKPIPIPRGLEVSTFQAWFLRVHHLGFSLVDEVLREGRRRIAWDARFGALGVHLAVLARFHAPTAVEGEMTNAQFWSRFEEHILAHAWFASNLTQYEGLRDLLQSMVTLLVTDGDSARLRRIAMQILRSFRSDPIPFPPASASSSSSSSSTLASTRTHLIQSGVKRTPPGLVQHEGVMSFLGMTVQAAGEMEKNEAKPEQSTSSPPSTTETFLLALLQELHEQFHLATAASESKLFHRSSMPVFGVIGLLQAIDGDATPAATNDSVDKPLAVVLEKARAELRSMLAALFNTPDVQSLYSHLRSLSPCHPTLSFGQPWPCTNSLGVCCNSCLFTIVVTTACVQGAKWIPNDDNITAASRRGPSQLARPPAHPKPSLLLISTTLVAHTFLHLIDTTWVLNGSIELAEELPMAATDGSSSQASDRSTAGAGASRPPPNPSAPSSPPRLLAWLSSPLYALLPHYTRAFSLLFLHLQSREEQQRLLGHVWRRVKYVHCVWRWYRTDGGGAGSVPLSSGATTFAAGDLTASGLKEAVERAKQAASEINEAPKTVKLPVSPALAPSPRSVRVSSTPIRLHRTTLRRAHSGCYLSLLMFLGAILRDARWRGAVAQEGENEVDDEEGRVTLAAASKQQAFSIAIIIDILSHLEFLASTVTVASGASNPSVSAAGGPQPGRNGFGPYKEVLEIVLALVTGREIRDAASSPSQSASLVEPSPNELVRRAHRAMLYRDAFARETMSMFIRCFFKPQSGEDEAKSVLLSPTLGLESAGSHLVKASKLPQFVALPYLLAASGLPFAPTILSHPSLQLPDPLTTPWPALTSKLTIAPPSSGSNSPGSFDAVTASRQYFLAGVFSGTASLLPFSMSFHYLLPFLFHLSTSQGERLRGLKKRGLQGLCGLVKRGFRVATMGVQENEEDDSSQMFPGLPLAPSGADLERFLRQLLPFLTSHVLASFPHYAGFQQVLEVYLCVFACVPGNDVLLLHSLQTLLTKSSSILVGLMENEARLKRWKQVTELAGRTRQDEGEDEDKEEDDAVEDDFQVYDLPQNVRLPQKFPSLTSVRKLLLLHLQLMQSLDGTLYPRALAQLDHLFTHTLSPSLHPVATPLRSSLAAMLHESLVRGFDLSKRDATAEWFIRMEERLNIPVGIQAPATPPQSLLPSGSSSSSHSSLIDAVKKAEASRPGRMVRANGTAGRSTARGSDALTRRPAEVVPPAPRLVCVEGPWDNLCW